MVMHPRRLARFPADGHHLKTVILVYKVTCVASRAPEQILIDRANVDRVPAQIIVYVVADEGLVGDIFQSIDKLADRYSVHGVF